MKPRTELVVEKADGELIVLDRKGGEVHQLNQSAALIWGSLSEGLGTDEIAKLLTNAFSVDPERAISDVQEAVAQFAELGLLEE